ncbi:hypothetical protein CQ018_01965 [Arthrobacter sp. MYb227]|uniref:alternate-type signal peptide domain-containing protein n=1 Tax=Arthrobacter sp. MYb227 TaxID=1848601 RepID=UPI000CFC12DC|nr:alternate-type signal peptide domain-containing protein [Arthrobacter sp. MYb227]PQZ96070.1 hypothetical protein CQ018_01965 [Arthrobacter sp. MYb227]
MNKATKGIIAGALGLGLLAGGATFAKWEDSVTVPGGIITAGNLDISVVPEKTTWQDVSDDIEGNPRSIDPATFLMVPGDTVRMTDQVKINLAGDNISAALTVDAPVLTGDLAAASDGVSGTVTLLDAAGTPVGPTADLGDPIVLNSANFTASDNDTTFTVAVDLDFDIDTPDQVRVNAAATLEGLTFDLKQTR